MNLVTPPLESDAPLQGESGDPLEVRREKLKALRKERAQLHEPAYPNDFRPTHRSIDLFIPYEPLNAASLEALNLSVRVAGRIMSKRLMGRTSFFHLQDESGQIQLYIRQDALEGGPSIYDNVKTWDLGDIVGAEGTLFRTKTGELSIKVKQLRLLSKSLRPLPDKWHGLQDRELCYRQRYLDLIMNEDTRARFKQRTTIIDFVRQFFKDRKFLEVETPMMQVIPGGATAKPFVTHHNALDLDLYLRIAPELYLKRLVVGGFERVFEINRNFRNEGLSTRHNPEFTMLEFYEAYACLADFIALTEQLLSSLVHHLHQRHQLKYQGNTIDFTPPFKRYTIKEALSAFHALTPDQLEDQSQLTAFLTSLHLPVHPTQSLAELQYALFEETVESQLIQPTFITDYPSEVSPLARSNDDNPTVADRAELFIAGREIANLFSELNDPEEQAERFERQAQAKNKGDEEAMHYDADYIMALEYGLPPTAGQGIGIDRLVMLLTDSPAIRDVILFPHLRPHT